MRGQPSKVVAAGCMTSLVVGMFLGCADSRAETASSAVEESPLNVSTTATLDGPQWTFVLDGSICFEPGSAAITAKGVQAVKDAARIILEKYAGCEVRVSGYADKAVIRHHVSEQTIRLLTQRRADAVKQALAAEGVDAPLITAIGRGTENLLATRMQSRRVEIEVMGWARR